MQRVDSQYPFICQEYSKKTCKDDKIADYEKDFALSV